MLVSHVETGSHLLPEIETDPAIPLPEDHLATTGNGPIHTQIINSKILFLMAVACCRFWCLTNGKQR